FYKIGLADLLHYMVTFNTGQRRMSLQVQLEIMRAPLIDSLKQVGIKVVEGRELLPGERRPKAVFAASDLVVAVQAFITSNPYVTGKEEAERFIIEDEKFLDNVTHLEDAVSTFEWVATRIVPKWAGVYADDEDGKQYVLFGQMFL